MLCIPASGTLFRNAAGASSSRYAWRDMWGSTFPVRAYRALEESRALNTHFFPTSVSDFGGKSHNE